MKKNSGLSFRFLQLFFLCLVFMYAFGASAAAFSDDTMAAISGNKAPLLRISYTAGTKGELYACVTCGTNSLGGLARRAKILNDFRSSSVPHLHFSGSEEFLSDLDLMRFKKADWDPNNPKNKHNESEKARRLSLAYSMLKVDYGWLSSQEAEWFKQYGINSPKGFQTVADKPQSKTFKTPQGQIALVLFPEGAGERGAPTKDQLKAVLAEGEKFKNSSSLVVGISPWGNVHEYRFIKEAEAVYSILLGGGGGLGGPYVQDHSSKSLLWIRSESHGRAVNVLEILELPMPGHKASWVEGLSFNAEQIFLFLKVPPEPAFDKALGLSYEEWWKE